jgi:hypothetical protein
MLLQAKQWPQARRPASGAQHLLCAASLIPSNLHGWRAQLLRSKQLLRHAPGQQAQVDGVLVGINQRDEA